MSILDQFGQPISSRDVRRLRDPVATPTLAGVRQVISDPVSSGITPDILATILREAEEGRGQRYFELAEMLEERDLHYLGVIGTRKRSVAQLPLTVEAASDDPAHMKHAEFIEQWLESGVLEAALFDILDAVGKGFSVLEIDWQTEPGRFVPRCLTYKPQRWFDVPVGIGQILGDSTTIPDGNAIMLRQVGGLEPLAPYKFVVHRHPAKSGLVMRSGLARIVCWAWMFKAFTAGDWAVFTRNYGAPVRLGRYGPESSGADRDVLWRAVANIAGDCAAIIPKSMEIEFIELGDVSKGSDLYKARCDWLDQQVSKAVLGQTATTDAIAGGHAVGQEHRQVQEDIERADAVMLAATITRQLFRPMIQLSFGPQTEYPRARVGRPDEMPADKLAEAVAKLVPQGLRVSQAEMRRRLTLTDPDDGEELLGAPVAPPAPTPALTVPPAGEPPVPAMLARLVAGQGGNAELLATMTERMALDAQGALSGLTAQVRQEFDAARDMPDLLLRLEQLRLDGTQFAEAMRAGLALAHLVGQASVLDEVGSPNQ